MRWWSSILIVLCGCGSQGDDPPAGVPDAAAGSSMDAGAADARAVPPSNEVTVGGDRPARLLVPETYGGGTAPLVILLHGYAMDAESQDAYFRLSARVDELGFFLLLPDGTREQSNDMNRFWNATDACCNFYGSPVDDVGYLRAVIEETKSMFAVGEVHVFGHSNGGFMAYRMACDAADVVDSIVSLAGSTFLDPGACRPSEPTRVLQIHGTGDDVILYQGETAGSMRYPGAEETVRWWADRGGCNLSAMDQGAPLDLEVMVSGSETDVETFQIGCVPGIQAELWRMNYAGHVPNFQPDFADRVLEWMLAR